MSTVHYVQIMRCSCVWITEFGR